MTTHNSDGSNKSANGSPHTISFTINVLHLFFTLNILIVTGSTYEDVNSDPKHSYKFSNTNNYRSSADNNEVEKSENFNNFKMGNTSENYKRNTVFSSIEISEIENIAKLMSVQLNRQFEDRTRYSSLSEEMMSIPFDITTG